MAPILEVKNLKTCFHGKNAIVTAVDGVSLSVEPGKTLGIVGESGCGKSVTALSILKLLPSRTARMEPGSSILLDGRELSGLTGAEMCQVRGREIAMIFQDPMTSLNPVMTIGKQMSEAFCAHGKMSREEAWMKSVEMLQKVGIPAPGKRAKEYPHQLSGGMKQRVMIAMALSGEPKVLIADEPTTALDVTIQAQILDLMEKLKREMNTAILLITHDMGVVAEMADEVMVMYAGQVMERAEAKALFQNPLHPYTKGLLASIPRLDQEVERLHTIKGNVPNLNEMPAGCRFSTRCPDVKDCCRTCRPEACEVDGHLVRCFQYDKKEGREWKDNR